ncbi:hypothetical protein ACIPZG_17370 [Pseudomonas sp. NPDC089395]|uniref:hypothetical protein n=1 Tax=Pseudomonas sp. NPDC089395 TaxID=3364460 RepID=UPI0038018AC4
MTDETVTENSNSLAIIEQSLMAFGAGMSVQARRDAKQSYRYASLRASKRYNSEGQTEQWFGEFLNAMGTCHWTIGKRDFAREHTSSKTLTIEAVAFKVTKAAAQALIGGPIADAVSKLVGDALSGLGNITEAQEIFKRNVKEKPSGTVSLGACIETSTGEVVMMMTAHSAYPSSNDLETLVFSWKSSGDEQYAGSAYLVHDTDMYDTIRDRIKQELQNHSEQDMKDHPI